MISECDGASSKDFFTPHFFSLIQISLASFFVASETSADQDLKTASNFGLHKIEKPKLRNGVELIKIGNYI